jgi:hypothetical protein
MDRQTFAAISTVVAAWGLVRGIMSIVGIRGLKGEDKAHWTDVWFYGVLPSALYIALGIVALALWNDWQWELDGLAAVITGLLLCVIRNEWDLITWIAPRHEGKGLQ